MKLFVNVLCYDRPNVLRHSVATIMANVAQQTDETHVLFTDDGDNEEVGRVLRHTVENARARNTHPVFLLKKSRSMGMVHSSKIALAYARMFNPQYWFIHESDYVFRLDCYERVLGVFEQTEEGKMALGIVGYDHPNFYDPEYIERIFPYSMILQMGEDNVNRSALHRSKEAVEPDTIYTELASNTCPTCYLNWHHIMEIGKEFPEIHDLLDQAVDPRDNPNYPASADYRRLQMFDDGMLSHAISLVWNRWAIKHGIDRDRFGAWLNIKPSVANAITGGGIHSSEAPEMTTTGGSPSWRDI